MRFGDFDYMKRFRKARPQSVDGVRRALRTFLVMCAVARQHADRPAASQSWRSGQSQALRLLAGSVRSRTKRSLCRWRMLATPSGHAGKFINGYEDYGGLHIPPGYADWHAFGAGQRFLLRFHAQRQRPVCEIQFGQYSTDVFVEKALGFHRDGAAAIRDVPVADLPARSFNAGDARFRHLRQCRHANSGKLQRIRHERQAEAHAKASPAHRRSDYRDPGPLAAPPGDAAIARPRDRHDRRRARLPVVKSTTRISFSPATMAISRASIASIDHKDLCYDEASRVPLYWRQPGGHKQLVMVPVLNIDATAAMVELAGATAGLSSGRPFARTAAVGRH